MDRLSWALVFLGIGGLACSVWVAWSKRDSMDLEWKLGIAGLLITSAMIVVGAAQGIKSQRESALAEAKLNSANEDIKQIAARFVTRCQMLTPEKRQVLLARFKELPPKSIALTVDTQDRECIDFGALLADFLDASGALRSQTDVKVVGERFDGMGVLVCASAPTYSEAAKKLADALSEVGIPGVRNELNSVRTNPDKPVVLAVMRLR